MTKVVEYVGCLHLFKSRLKEGWSEFWDGETVSGGAAEKETNFRARVRGRLERLKEQTIRKINQSAGDDQAEPQDFSHIYRPKTRAELVKVSAAVMGIEFSYAAETAFVSPLLLNIGLRHRHMTLMWCLSPLIGFFITPILGSLSDGCRSSLGRRRPFIILLSIGIVLGLLLVPNGKTIGIWLGDTYSDPDRSNRSSPAGSQGLNLTQSEEELSLSSRTTNLPNFNTEFPPRSSGRSALQTPNATHGQSWDKMRLEADRPNLNSEALSEGGDYRERTEEEYARDESEAISQHPWGLIVTVLGTVLLDFDADACQSPSRAYMLDVTIPEDHARGLSTFTIMAGLGGSLGYFLGALNWENTFLGDWFGGHVRAVFTLVLFLFIGCVVTTVRSFREIPIERLWAKKPGSAQAGGSYCRFEDDPEPGKSYGTIEQETSFTETPNGTQAIKGLPIPRSPEPNPSPTVREYIKTIIQLPRSLQWLCLTNFFSWMSLVCYSLYFTDFVGEAVYGGDPAAPVGSPERVLYEEGVRFGCWGMSLYSLSCSIYSFVIERLVQRFGAKRTYICGQLVYSVGMVFMALARHPVGVLVFSWTAGIMYATLFTMPYLLVARYHAADTFDVDFDDLVGRPSQMRGLGTDVAVVSSMVFLAQMTQSLILGNVVAATGTTTAIVCAAAIFAACGSLAASKVLYLDL